jgi:pimeloyl-ACP methyl ester carboxylesterase
VVKYTEKALNITGYNCPSLHYDAKGIPIVFLHGMSYTNEIWQKIGVTELLIEKNIPFLALDMPYGIKSRCHLKTRNVQKNVSVINEAVKTVLGGAPPVLVGASIGGNMALQYAARFPVRGLLLIGAAMGLEPELAAAYHSFKFPTTLIWGSYDSIVGGEEMRALSDTLPNSKLLVYSGAGHSAYRDQPERFKQDLLELYVKAEQT